MTHGALRRGACCGGVRGIGAAGSGPRRCAIALARVSNDHGLLIASLLVRWHIEVGLSV